MSRRTARRHAFFLIFQIEFHREFDPSLQTEIYLEDKEAVPEEDREFIHAEVNGAYDCLSEIDAHIIKFLSGWEIDRISKIDLALLRLAVYEMLYEQGIPNGVSINEAVELAKTYGDDDSYQFINGILGNIFESIAQLNG